MTSLQNRVIGALKLQASTFEDVEHDATATSQAATVVAAAGASAGLVHILYGFGVTAFIMQVILALIGWVIASAVIFFVGTKFLPGKNTEADLGQLLRVVGFANAPGLFGFVNIVPLLGWLVAFLLWIWTICAMVVGVRQALDYADTGRAIIVCVIAWAIMLMVSLLAALVGIGSAALGTTF